MRILGSDTMLSESTNNQSVLMIAGIFGNSLVTLTLMTNDNARWWEITDDCSEEQTSRRMLYPKQDCKRVVLYAFTQKFVTGILNYINTKG